MYDARWVLELWREHSVKYVIINHYAVHLKPIQINIACKL